MQINLNFSLQQAFSLPSSKLKISRSQANFAHGVYIRSKNLAFSTGWWSIVQIIYSTLFLEAEKASIEASVNAWKEKRDTAGEEIELDQAEADPDIYAVPPDMSDADRLEEGKDLDFFY